MNDISTTSTSGMASGKIQTDLVRRTIRARTGIDRDGAGLSVPDRTCSGLGTAVGSGGAGAPGSVSFGFGGHGLLLVP